MNDNFTGVLNSKWFPLISNFIKDHNDNKYKKSIKNCINGYL